MDGPLPTLFGVQAMFERGCIALDPISMSNKVIGRIELAGDRGLVFHGRVDGCPVQRDVKVAIDALNVRQVCVAQFSQSLNGDPLSHSPPPPPTHPPTHPTPHPMPLIAQAFFSPMLAVTEDASLHFTFYKAGE